MNPAASSLASSFLMASLFSAENFRSCCFLGIAVGLTFKECSINSFGTPGMSAGFHANTSQLALRKLTSALSYLESSPVPISAVLLGLPVWRSIALKSCSLVGLTLFAVVLFSRISSSVGLSFLDAVKTCCMGLGVWDVAAIWTASVSHSYDLLKSPRKDSSPFGPGILSTKYT